MALITITYAKVFILTIEFPTGTFGTLQSTC